MQAHLVAAGKYHDIDFARLELLKLLPQNGHPLLTAVDEADLRPWQEHHDHQARNTATTAEINDADATDR